MKKRVTFYFIASCLFFSNGRAVAVPASPNPVVTIQPDGTKITFFVRGDEKVHWLQSPNGYTLLFNNDKFVVYAEKDREGNLAPSSYVYRDIQPAASNINAFLVKTSKNLRYSEEQIQMLSQIRTMTRAETNKPPVVGSKRALCILMGFKDRAFSKTLKEFENLMNQVGYSAGGAVGSVKDFYRENSYGQMDLTVTVVGPYIAQNNVSYYVSNSGKRALAAEAVFAANKDVSYQDFATNGALETFHIIFAGYGAENGLPANQYIWSHNWELASPIVLDGIKISSYSCSPELRGRSGSAITSIGVICHELCHGFGADDYYDMDYAESGGEYPGTGYWDLMAMGAWNGPNRDGTSPAHINMFQKILYGWVDPNELTSPTVVNDMPNSTKNPVAYVVKPSLDEWYLLENRQKISFDAYLPGTGLLIYHIHPLALLGKINNTTHPQQAYIVCASSLMAIPSVAPSSYGIVDSERTPFTNVSGRNEFSGTSFPRMFRWDGTEGIAVTDKPITDIVQSNQLISFVFKGGCLPPCLPITDLNGVIENKWIRLSWNAPANSTERKYRYTLCLNDAVIEEAIEDTFVYYQPERGGRYRFGIVAYSENCVLDTIRKDMMNIRIIKQPSNVVVCGGEVCLLQVATEPERRLLYQWYRNGQPIEGAKSKEYLILLADEEDIGNYYVKVKDMNGSYEVQSEVAKVNLQKFTNSGYSFAGLPDRLKTQSDYLVFINPVCGELPEISTFHWTFSNNLAVCVPGEMPNSVYLFTGMEGGSGRLSVEIPILDQTITIDQEIIIENLTGIRPPVSSGATLFPNPFSDVLHIMAPSEIIRIVVTGLNACPAQIIDPEPGLPTRMRTIQTSHWAAGVYIVRLVTKEGIIVCKTIKL
jgi:M6 family metalloprotease-like protein